MQGQNRGDKMLLPIVLPPKVLPPKVLLPKVLKVLLPNAPS